MHVTALILARSSAQINLLVILNLLKYSTNITQLLLYSSLFDSGAETKWYNKLMNI